MRWGDTAGVTPRLQDDDGVSLLTVLAQDMVPCDSPTSIDEDAAKKGRYCLHGPMTCLMFHRTEYVVLN